MLRDNLVGLIAPMQNRGTPASHDRSACLENPRPAGVESSLTGRSSSPFQTEPRQLDITAGLERRPDWQCGAFPTLRQITCRKTVDPPSGKCSSYGTLGTCSVYALIPQPDFVHFIARPCIEDRPSVVSTENNNRFCRLNPLVTVDVMILARTLAPHDGHR